MADPETLATTPAPASASTKKKKKHSKKRKSIDESEAAAAAAVEAIDVTVDASLTGGRYAAAAPVVAYFPSGYDPLAAGREPPSSRLFRNVKHPSWIDLVVRSPAGGPDFVGTSYTGEAAVPQLCSYALGVLDKASGTLKVVPIAGEKILRLEPHLEVQKPAHSEQSGVASEAGSAVATGEMKVQDLTGMYGAQKDKETDKKWRSLNEHRNDPSAYEDLDLGRQETNASDSQAPEIVRNIPPYDLTADTSETAYLFDEIIPKNIRSHLLEILGHLESGEFSSKGYGTFVSNRVHKLEKLEGEDKERFAWILSYITHLLTLLARNSSMSKRHRKDNQATKAPAVPQAVYRKLLVMFTEEGSSALSTEKHELLVNYILVLSLFADDFRSDPTDISADLKMTRQMIKPYYEQLGCKVVTAGAFKPTFMTLPAPLKFPKEITRRKRQRK
ncbi:hypothetical protein EJB05_26556 [Eragrostis curvula]|uniref:DNA-directed RNA polymerase I subunit rpa49 n=1 Tax=Eragrostis curvula TaxID=38414 RepID=A0A5J9UL57_9POAL|nr:hypothetical protein EJB05_26556 [Eragrostis curvula]